MIEPGRFASIRRRATACAMKKAARTLRAKMASKSSILHVHQDGRPVGAGIVDQDVERVGGARWRPRTASRSVTSSTSASAALAAGADRGRRLLDLASGARRERHVRARRGKRRGSREPDAAPAAGDQRAPAVEPERGRGGELHHSAAWA